MLVLLEMLIYLKHGYYYYVSIIIQNLKKIKIHIYKQNLFY